MAGKILVIRGGAIGDFILTLPSLRLLRENFPEAHIEILGYRHITAIADQRYYANATRNMEYAGLAGFFNPKSELNAELKSYFAGFQQIVSYLYDPDGFFEYNLRRCGVKNFIVGNAKLHDHAHASRQLAEPLTELGIFLQAGTGAIIFPTDNDIAEAEKILRDVPAPRLAIHPGSGSAQKNWPREYWLAWMEQFLKSHPQWKLIVLGGESDVETLQVLRRQPFSSSLKFIEHLELPLLAAVLRQCQGFLGHDSGISHLAAAAGCRSVLLFGPSNPHVWAPIGDHVKVLKSATGMMKFHSPEKVAKLVESFIIAPSSQ